MTAGPTYRLGNEIGRGALGRVVEVFGADGSRLAGKILHDSHHTDAGAQGRFAGEARIASGLRHPNVVAVHGLHSIDGHEVLVMDLAPGQSLARIIARDAPLPLERVVSIGRALAAGLAAAHHAGLIHRDLKPENVLVDDDDVARLVDFGMARATSFAGVDASAFAVVGTPDYMAPESIDPLAVDARSDLYSLGCILFEMTTGAPPFSGATAFAVLAAHRNQPMPALTVGPERPAALIAIIGELLAKSPADRPQSAAAAMAALADVTNPAAAALTVSASTAVAHGGRCASCGAPVLAEVRVCFGCGMRRATLQPGPHTVFVIGPGAVSDKLGTALRERLLQWIEANPELGLIPDVLAKSVPRLPFVVARRVSESSATSLAESLRALGLTVEVTRGGRYSLPAIRRKGLKLGGRISLIGLTSMTYGLHNVVGPALVPVLALFGVAAVGAGFVKAGQPVTRQGTRAARALPEAMAASLERIAGAVPGMRERRHRDALRAVVQRALQLEGAVPAGERDAVERDLAQLLDLALIGTTRVDDIDATLAERDLRNPGDEDRALMRERDAWSARILEVTAFLDAIRARYAHASAPATGAAAPDLTDLRAHIDALEEIEAL